MFRRFIFLFYLITAGAILPVNCQQVVIPVENRFFISPSLRTGNILNIYSNLPDHSLAIATDVNVAWQTRGEQYWNQYFRFPQVGLIFSHVDFGNPGELGYEFSLLPNMAFHLKTLGKFNLYGFLALGFAWFNNPYERIENPTNKLIGARITNKTVFGFDLNYEISKKLLATAGISYLHYSDGHFQLPNVGINIPSVQVGLKYFPRSNTEQFFRTDSTNYFDKDWLFNLRLGLGVHEFGDPVKPTGGPKYPIYDASAYLSKRLGVVSNFQAGLWVNYYTSFYDFIRNQETYDKNRRLKSSSLTVFAGMEWFTGHVGYVAQMGIYVYNPFLRKIQEIRNQNSGFKNVLKEYLAYKLGAQFYLFNTRTTTRLNPWIGIFLKTNAGQADFSEISFGCAF